mgnify:FL=1
MLSINIKVYLVVYPSCETETIILSLFLSKAPQREEPIIRLISVV